MCAEPAVPINISASPAVAAYLIAPAIAGFTRKHPGITLSLSGVSHHVLLNKSEADIAVRLERPDDPDLMTRRIGTMRFGLYAFQFWQEIPQEDWVFIAYDSTLARVTQQQWLESPLNGRRVIFRASDLMAQQQAARKGLGIVTLPCFMGDNDSELVRLPENLPSPVRNIWLVAYPEIKRDHSAVVVMDFLTEIIGGSCPPGKDI